MIPSPQSLFRSIGKGFFLFPWLLSPLALPDPAGAYQILFYYNGSGVNGAVLRCAAILRKAGNTVTTRDVAGRVLDPTADNWGAPYDQVWDMRFVNRDKEDCGSGSPLAADYFDERWRRKAVSYLNHCGKLFVAGEHYQLADRDEGLYDFLSEIHAVKEGFDDCPPSRSGNSTTDGDAFYPVRHGLGPVSFFGAFVGGIPLAYLNGTNFVSTNEDWQGGAVDRSVVAGWREGQMGGSVNAPLCARGKLLIVWDATMWTLWDREVTEQAERAFPVWEDSAWFSWNPDAEEEKGESLHLRQAQAATKKFFPALAKWLGRGRDCPCEGPGPAATPLPTAVPKPAATFTPTVSVAAVKRPPLDLKGPSAPETIVFSVPPVNIYMRFRDGAGNYRLDVFDAAGAPLRKVFEKKVTIEKETWTSWDGFTEDGRFLTTGTYYAVLSKDGKELRKIRLSWIKTNRP